MGFFKPAWMTDKPAKEVKAIAAVKEISDPEQLAEIACSAPLANVAMAAVERIDDDALLCRVAMPGGAEPTNVRASAFAKVGDRETLLSLMDVYRDSYINRGAYAHHAMGKAVEDAYARLVDPPFEWMLTMRSKKAGEDLLAAVAEMEYPDDRDKLVRIALEKGGDAAEWAVTMLPYEQERDILREIVIAGMAPGARASAVSALKCPDDRDVVDAVLADRKSSAELKRRVARLLPDDDSALDEPCCPYCGAIGSVHRTGGYDGSAELYYSAYVCSECAHESRQWDYIGPATDFSVTLREFREK